MSAFGPRRAGRLSTTRSQNEFFNRLPGPARLHCLAMNFPNRFFFRFFIRYRVLLTTSPANSSSPRAHQRSPAPTTATRAAVRAVAADGSALNQQALPRLAASGAFWLAMHSRPNAPPSLPGAPTHGRPTLPARINRLQRAETNRAALHYLIRYAAFRPPQKPPRMWQFVVFCPGPHVGW